jgi:hypothetical protein
MGIDSKGLGTEIRDRRRDRPDQGRQHARQVADHRAGLLRPSQLDRPVQILDDLTEPAGNLKDHNATYGVCPDPHLRTLGCMVG